MRFIPSYQEAVDICQRNPVFYETKHRIGNYDVSVFNYRLATFDDFRNENAFEMRGLTFVFNTDGSLFKRFLGLEKFFNVNETEMTQLHSVKDYEIIDISDKLDGSCITFIELPDGTIIPKTKNSFDADQAKRAMKFYREDDVLREFVKYQISIGRCVFFEYTSPLNRIVLKYADSRLSLTRIRDGMTGEYILNEDVPEGLKTAKNETFEYGSLADMMKEYETLENKEGSVVTFRKPDGDTMLMKVKTADYFAKHHLLTEFIYQENVIVEMILNETIDDALSIVDDDETKGRITGLIKITQQKFSEEIAEAQKYIDAYLADTSISAKDFYQKYSGMPGFGDALVVVNHMRKGDYSVLLDDVIKKRLLRQTYHLMDAREWLGI